jgi:hypothetical protein
MDAIRAALSERARSPDKLFLLSPAAALDFINAGRASGYALVGIDGYRKKAPQGYEPAQGFSRWMAHSAETSRDGRSAFETEVKGLIESCNDGTMSFEVWLESDSELDRHRHA